VRSTLRHWWFGEDRSNRWVVPVASGLVAAQLGYRAWATFGSWWEGDDFVYIARAFAPGGTSPSKLLLSYAGHLLPADFYLTWIVNTLSPYNWTLAASTVTAMQLLANIGFLRFLLIGFGRRWGIIPPLVLYLVTSFTIQDSVWWATAVQSLPFKISLCWALGSQVRYAQTRRPGAAISACLWVAFGLLFYEKTLLVIGAAALLTVLYFTRGTVRERLAQTWREYRLSVVMNVLLGLTYLAIYVRFGKAFGPSRAAEVPIGPTADVMLLRSWGTVVLGGPLRWVNGLHDPVSYSHPSSVTALVSWVVLLLLVRAVLRSRTGSLRALALPGYFLACDIVLVAAGRAGTYGPLAGTELRYLTELSVATAAGLALATMPLRGSSDPVTVRRPSALLDRRLPAAGVTLAVALLATVSTAQYVLTWHQNQPAKAAMANLLADARSLPAGTQVVNEAMPQSVLWPIAYPDNTVKRLLEPLHPDLDFVQAGTDRVFTPGPDGHLMPLVVTPVRTAQPGPTPDCGYRIGRSMTRIDLDGPVLFGGWWVRIGYLATADSALTVRAGGAARLTSVTPGFHTLYVRAGDAAFRSVEIGGMVGDGYLCTNDLTVGRVQAFGAPGPTS
jgi:hypothetical protein